MPSSIARGRPKTTYYHNGIGGRGNYHKRAEGADPPSCQCRSHFARSLAAFFSRGGSGNAPKKHVLAEDGTNSNGKSRELSFPSRWFIGIGALGSRGARRQHSLSSDMSATTVTPSEYTSQALPHGTAYVIRRKILGERSAPKPGEE